MVMYYVQYSGIDLGAIAIDIVGGLLNGLAINAGTIAAVLVVTLIVLLVVDLLTGIFGIFSFMKGRSR